MPGSSDRWAQATLGEHMPTDEYKPLLDRAWAIQNAVPLVEVACPLLREVVNHATWAFQRCQAATDKLGAENEDAATFVLYRHIIELADGVEVLFASSCVEAAVPLLRAGFEASVSLDYILLESDQYVWRSLTWLCAYIHARMDAYEQLDGSTKRGAAYARARAAELGEHADDVLGFDAGTAVQGLQSVLDRDQFREIEAEYTRARHSRGGRPPDWFTLFGGPRNRRELAQRVGREAEYLSFYGPWSGFSHAADASTYLRPGRSANEAAFLGVRSAHEIPHRAFLATGIVIHATRQMIERFRAGEDLTRWYQREVKPRWDQLQRMRVVIANDGSHDNTAL